MKSKFTPVYTTFFLLLILFLFLGNSNNPPNGRTGAPGDGLCTDCHDPGNPNGYDGEVIIENWPNDISPNTDYSITVRVTNPNGLAFLGGFQAVVLDSNNDNIGNLTVSGSNPTTQTSGGREYVEHNPSINFPGSNEVTWDFTWTSPAGPSSEMITMYAAGNIASGNNGNDDDLIVTTNVTGTMMDNGDPLEVEIVSSQNVSCNGGNDGSATANATGGSPPYDYLWSNSSTTATASNLTAGVYDVTVTDNLNATAMTMVTITEPPFLVASIISQTNIDCNNPSGSATASGSGGTPPYNYNWSSGGTNPTEFFTNPGEFNVSVTDANLCIDVAMVTITEDTAPPVANAGSDGQLDCNTQLLVLDGSGSSVGQDFTYLWTTFDGNIVSGHTTLNPTINAPGTYTLTVTNQVNGCTASDDVVVIEIEEITLFIAGNDVTCNGGNDGSINLTVTGGEAPFDYDWNDDTLDGMEDPTNLTAGNYCVTVTDANDCTENTCIDITEPTQITLSASVTDISCFGNCDGSIDLTTSGGVGNYTFEWSGPNGYANTIEDIDELCPGDYYVTVTDGNGCTATLSETITEPSEITSSATITDALCNGSCDGSIDLSVSGGTSPYTYEWDTTDDTEDISDLCTGTYSVTITDDNGCESSASFTVGEPSEISISATINDALCYGSCDGSIDLSVSGGTSPYTYEWDTDPNQNTEDINDLCAGDFTVIVTDDNGCSATATYTVTEPAPLTATSSVTDVTCNGDCDGTANISVDGGTPPYEYDWDGPYNGPNPQDMCAGTFTVTITDANECTTTIDVTIEEPPALELQLSSTNESAPGANDGTATADASGGTPLYTYLWDDNANQTTATATNLAPGTYCVIVTDENGCTISGCVTVNEGNCDLTASVSTTEVSCIDSNDASAEAFPNGGTEPYSYNWSSGGNEQTESDLSIGSYSVTVSDASDCEVIVNFTISGPPALELEMTSTDESSNGASDGTATANVSGGISDYLYTWDDPNNSNTSTIENLSPGTYCVTVSDLNDCTITGCVTVNSGGCNLEGVVSVSNVSCNGGNDGSAVVTVTGGTAPYAYEWSSGGIESTESDLSASVYTVTISDADGCEITIEVTVTEPIPLELSMSSTDETAMGASDGTATAEVSGGTCCYFYLWDTDPIQTQVTATNLSPGTYCVTVTDFNGCTIEGCVNISTSGCNLDLEISNVDFTCIDECNGSIDLTVLGGEAPFDYDWSNGATVEDPVDLCADDYLVTVTDANGCSKTISTTIEEVEIDLNAELLGIDCFDDCTGFIDLTVEGGNPPYSYLWNNGETTEDIDSLCVDFYEVTVTDANGCIKVGIPTITTPSAISIVHEVIAPLCHESCDGAIDLTVTGGIPPYNYDWDDDTLDGIEDPTNLCGGNYNVVISDSNGCTINVSILVKGPSELLLTAFPEDASCFGECDGFVTINGSGGTPPYIFSGSTDMLCSGNYTITVTDANGCSTLTSFEIGEPNELIITIDEIGNEMNTQNDGFVNVTVEGGTEPYSYNWMLDGSTISNEEDPTGLAAGNYTLEVIDANGCLVAIEEIIVDNIVGIVDHDLKNSIRVFPNPSSGLFQIEFDLIDYQFVEFEIFDFTGKKILEQQKPNVFNQKIQFNLDTYAKGVYTLKINIGDDFLIKRIVLHD